MRADFLDSSVRRLQKEPDSDCMEIYCTKKAVKNHEKSRPDFMKNSSATKSSSRNSVQKCS